MQIHSVNKHKKNQIYIWYVYGIYIYIKRLGILLQGVGI